MAEAKKLQTLLKPLLEALDSCRGVRLVARPGWVVVDRADGPTQVEVSWSKTKHQQAVDQTVDAKTLETGHAVASVAGNLVLHRPLDPQRRVDDLAQDGWVSPLAGRTLAQSVGLGRNVLLVGPWAMCVELAGALLADGHRPAVVGGAGDATPASWPLLGDAKDVHLYGADRVGAWSLAPRDLVDLMSHCSGVVGWIDARRLDQSLIRFEAAVEGGGSQVGPLRVLASVDLVVVTANHDAPRVQSIAEIVLAEEGYRPRVLFASGLPPVPTALVPVGVPTFVGDLARAGHTVLADELAHSVAEAPVPRPPVAVDVPVETGVSEVGQISDRISEPPQPRRAAVSPVPSVPEPQIDPDLEDAPPPGWELDQLGDEDVVEDEGRDLSADAATMAATFGLAPPPRPPGVRPSGFEGSFQDALQRAREREAEMAREIAAEAAGDDGEQ